MTFHENHFKILFFIRICLYFLLFILPLFVFPYSDDSYILPKWVLIEIVVLYLGFILFWKDNAHIHNLVFTPHSVCIPLFLFILIHGLSFFYAQSKTLAIYRITQWTFLLILYWVILRISHKRKPFLIVCLILIISAALTSFWIILQDYRVAVGSLVSRLPDWRGYLVAGLGNSDYVAGFLAVLFPIGVSIYFSVKNKFYEYMLLIYAIVNYAALIITYSVGANAGLITGLGIMVLILLTILKRNSISFRNMFIENRYKVIKLLISVLIVTLFYVIPNPLNGLKINGKNVSIFQQAFSSKRWKEGGNTRIVIWLNTIEIIKSHPLLGIGSGNFTFRYLDKVSPVVLENPKYTFYAGEYTNAAHNELLQIWAELGILGLIIFGWLIIQFFYLTTKLLKRKQDSISFGFTIGIIGSMVTLCLYGLMSYPFHLPVTAVIFIWLLTVPTILQNSMTDNGLIHKPDSNTESKEFAKNHLINSAPSWYRIIRAVSVAGLLIVLSIWLISPLISDIYFRQGKIRKLLGQSNLAIDSFDKAIQWSDHADAEYNLGELLFQEGRIHEALESYNLCAKKRKDKYIYLALAKSHFCLNDYSKAEYYLNGLIARNPEEWQYWNFLWIVYLKSDQEKLAGYAYEKTQRLKHETNKN